MISARSTLSSSLILIGINWVTLVYVPEVVKLDSEPVSFVEVTVLTTSTTPSKLLPYASSETDTLCPACIFKIFVYSTFAVIYISDVFATTTTTSDGVT